MKSTKKNRNLKVKRETVRTLTPRQLAEAFGAGCGTTSHTTAGACDSTTVPTAGVCDTTSLTSDR